MDSDTAARARLQLIRDEGRKPYVYQDSLGFWTLGVGRCVDPKVPGTGLSAEEIDYLLSNDLAKLDVELAQTYPWYLTLNPARQAALLNMRFELGGPHLATFSRMLAALEAERWADAAFQALDSQWAKVQSPARARRIARQFETGEWQ